MRQRKIWRPRLGIVTTNHGSLGDWAAGSPGTSPRVTYASDSIRRIFIALGSYTSGNRVLRRDSYSASGYYKLQSPW